MKENIGIGLLMGKKLINDLTRYNTMRYNVMAHKTLQNICHNNQNKISYSNLK